MSHIQYFEWGNIEWIYDNSSTNIINILNDLSKCNIIINLDINGVFICLGFFGMS